MSTASGKTSGLSKAVALCHFWFTCQVPYSAIVDWSGAWTAVDMKYYTTARLPILMKLAQATEDFFWVRIKHFHLHFHHLTFLFQG